MYYRFLDTEVGIEDVLPGVIFAAVGWAALQGLFQIYLVLKDPGSGSFLGSVVIIVTYLYFTGLVRLLGAVINAIIGDHSSGAPGGVGRDATSYDTETTASLNRDELADYLRDLCEEVAGRYERMRPAGDATDDGHPRPAGDVELVEHSSARGDTRQWAVTLRWEVADEANVPANSPDD